MKFLLVSPRLSAWWQRIPRADWETIALFLGIKALLFFFAVQTFTTMAHDYSGALEIWKRWDATHYMQLAQDGYATAGKDRVLIAFFPFYPWLVRGVALVVGHYLIAAFVVSGFASIAAALLLRRLAEFDEAPDVSRAAVWFFAIFPTAYFLHIPYTEGLFLAFALGSIVAVRSDRWALAGLLGACASLTRINGLILMPVLAVEAFGLWRARRRLNPRWLWMFAVAVGFLGYLWLNQHVAGDPFAFSHAQQDHWYKRLTPPWVGIRDVWLRMPGGNSMEGLHEFLYIVFTLLCTVWCWMTLRPSYAVWMTCNWLLVTSTTFIVSVPRYSLTLFPIFILLARACTGRWLVSSLVTVFSLLFFALYAARFAHGLWAF